MPLVFLVSLSRICRKGDAIMAGRDTALRNLEAKLERVELALAVPVMDTDGEPPAWPEALGCCDEQSIMHSPVFDHFRCRAVLEPARLPRPAGEEGKAMSGKRVLLPEPPLELLGVWAMLIEGRLLRPKLLLLEAAGEAVVLLFQDTVLIPDGAGEQP
mmetsp:Transcript_98400/g.205207  ORF Transcript_98400/g.205207 Transcript_98400/m.205207 type:complete len:158 (+) Transcript_98400:611-1084(+)